MQEWEIRTAWDESGERWEKKSENVLEGEMVKLRKGSGEERGGMKALKK